MNQIINNSLIGLNEVGGVFFNYTANVFIQTALLVILLFIIDLLLRKRVRAIFRYCVWLLADGDWILGWRPSSHRPSRLEHGIRCRCS